MEDIEKQLFLLEKVESTAASGRKFEEIRELYEDAQARGDRELIGLRIDDIRWRIKRRPVYGGILILLLFLQNAAVFTWTFMMGENIKKVETAFNFLITGTLVETALIIRIIVEWLFKEIDFSLYKRELK
jgi:hypothetical protein